MKGKLIMTLGLGIILLAGLISPVAGENDSLHVILVVEDRNYSVGDTVTVQLMIYESGALTNAAGVADIHLGVGTDYNYIHPTNITVANSGTGIYTGSYTIRAADANHGLHFFYDVTIGNDRESAIFDMNNPGALVVPVYAIADTVDVSFGGQKIVPARPGDALTATVLTRTGIAPISVAGFTQLYIETPTGQVQNLTYTEVQTGVYHVDFTVPQVVISGPYYIWAQPMGMTDADAAIVAVNVMDVWYHKIAATGSTVSFELCVADLLGAPVEGANFNIQRAEWPNDVFTGVTNTTGKALVHVPDVYGQAWFVGYVLAAGMNQSVSGAVFNPVPETPDNNGFDVIWEGTDTVFGRGEDVSIPYGAYQDQIPAASQDVYYYVTARGTDFDMHVPASATDFDFVLGTGYHVGAAREVLAAGKVTTNALGKFDIEFTAPDAQSVIDVRLEVPLDRSDYPGMAYDHEDDMYYHAWPANALNTDGFVFHTYGGKLDGDGGVHISGGFRTGKDSTLEISLSAGAGDSAVTLWGIGEASLEDSGPADPEWMSWVPYGQRLRMDMTESGKYEAHILVPQFIEGQDVTVIAGYMDSADGTPHFDAKTISPGGALPWLWIIIILAIIAVVVVLAIVLKSRL